MGIEVSAGGKSKRYSGPFEKIGEANVLVWGNGRMELCFADPRGTGDRVYQLNVSRKTLRSWRWQ
jgi:hypothetical protein